MGKLPERRAYIQPKVALVTAGKEPQQPHDIPRGMEMAEKLGLEFLPPLGA